MENIGTAAKSLISSPSRRVSDVPRNDLPALRDADGVPAMFDRECDLDLPRKLYAAWTPSAGPRAIRRALIDTERTKLQGRANALRAALTPYTDRVAVAAAISAMLSSFRSLRQEGQAAFDLIESLGHLLRDFPGWVIERGCASVQRGEAGLDSRFAPNDAEIAAVMRRIVAPYRKALDDIEALLEAPVDQPEPPHLTAEEIAAKRRHDATSRRVLRRQTAR